MRFEWLELAIWLTFLEKLFKEFGKMFRKSLSCHCQIVIYVVAVDVTLDPDVYVIKTYFYLFSCNSTITIVLFNTFSILKRYVLNMINWHRWIK